VKSRNVELHRNLFSSFWNQTMCSVGQKRPPHYPLILRTSCKERKNISREFVNQVTNDICHDLLALLLLYG
jgi:hypothetical protein